MIHYIIQVVVFQSIFLLVYELLLRRQTFFNWNRVYLLSTSILSLLLPFMKFSLLSQYTSSYGAIQLPEVVLGGPVEVSQMSESAMETAGITIEQVQTPIWQYIIGIGTVVFALWFLVQCIRLLILRSQNPKRWSDNVLVVSLKDSLQAFSFFNTIFLGSKIDQEERDLILKHEMVHVKQGHSLDVIWFQLLRIVFWFNPCVYMYQNRITELHEFIADRQVLATENRSEFYNNLLRHVFQVKTLPLTNSFFSNSLIKKRLAMINNSNSSNLRLWRYALILPVAISMLFYVSCEKEALADEISEELNLAQYSYTMDYSANAPTMPADIKVINDKYEAFLKTHPDYVGWGIMDPEDQTISFSVHHKDEQPDFEYHELEASFPDGSEYSILMNISPFMEEGIFEAESISEKDYADGIEVPYATIDKAPAFESCAQLSGEERKQCTSMEVAKFVNKNFNIELASEFGFVGRQQISVLFKIDEEGNVFDARARGPHAALEDEAVRVINALPQFIPGEHNGEAVVVPYSLPISFEIR